MMFVKEIWKKNVSEPFWSLFKGTISPEKLTWSFSLGIIGGLFPIPGITSLVCLVFTFLFPVNAVAIQLVNFALTPIELACVLPFVKAGNWIFGIDTDVDQLMNALDTGILGALQLAGSSLGRGIIAWALLSLLMAPLFYGIILPIIKSLTRKMVAQKEQ